MLPTRMLQALEQDLGADRAAGNLAADRGYDDGCGWALTMATDEQLHRLVASMGVRPAHGADVTAPQFLRTVAGLFGELLRMNGFPGTLSESQSLHYWAGFAAGALDVYERTPDARREAV